MNKKVQIFVIYANDCSHCENVIKHLEKWKTNSEIECDIKIFHYDTRIAIKIAIQNDFDDLPALLIGNTKLKGNKFSLKDIDSAIIKEAKKK